jgi:hypothetical protein
MNRGTGFRILGIGTAGTNIQQTDSSADCRSGAIVGLAERDALLFDGQSENLLADVHAAVLA